MKQLTSWFAIAGTAIVLAACGGGGGGGDPAPPVQADPLDGLPAEATKSVSAWIGFLDNLRKAAGADMREGFGLSAVGITSVPGDDVAEPTALNP